MATMPFGSRQSASQIVALLLLVGALLQPVGAATIVEYFNGYGTTNSDMNGKSGGSGWNADWSGSVVVDYKANSTLVYTAPGYSSAGDLSGTNNGSGTSTSTTGNLVFRTFTGLTGTIWMTVLMNQSPTHDTLFWLDKTNTTASNGSVDRDFIALRNSIQKVEIEAFGATGGLYNPTSTATFAVNTTHLLLVRVDMNNSGNNDLIQVWMDPDLSGVLGAPLLTSSATPGDFFGATFDGVGFSTGGANASMDAIRISNEADGFLFVTTGVPEPSISALFLLGGMASLLRRQRNRGTASRC